MKQDQRLGKNAIRGTPLEKLSYSNIIYIFHERKDKNEFRTGDKGKKSRRQL